MRILIVDIETAPNQAYVWGKYQQDVIEYVSEWYMMMFAYKWLGEKDTYVVALPDFETYEQDRENDYELVKVLHGLFDQADVIIAHNGDSFDVKKSNARFIYHGLTKPSFYRTIDTKKVAKRYFKFNSNKLDDLGELLGVGRKINTGGFALWKGCMAGDQKAWDKMRKYNIQDVKLLEKIYILMRGWMDNHPHHSMYTGDMSSCPICGSNRIQKRGYKPTKTMNRRAYQCRNSTCMSWFYSRVPIRGDRPEYV